MASMLELDEVEYADGDRCLLAALGGNSIGLNLLSKRSPTYDLKVDRIKLVYDRYLFKDMGHPNMRLTF